MTSMLEVEMEKKILQYLSACEDFKIVGTEVPFLSRCIDIVMLNQANDLISIELKIKDWKHAIAQALNHKLGSDYAYICLPKRKMTNTLKEYIYKSNIGLLMFDDSATQKLEIVVEAPRNDNQTIFKQLMLQNLKNCPYLGDAK